MTIRTIKSNDVECNRVADHHQRFLIRSDKERYRLNEVFHLQNYRQGRPVKHKVEKTAFLITLIMGRELLPLEDGCQLIGFREL